MITTAFINLGYYILSSLISVFPSGTGFPTVVHTAFSTLGGYLSIVDPIVSVPDLATCVGLVIGVEIAIFGFRTFKWILHFIPWIGGNGV